MAKLLVAEDDHLMRWSLEKFLIREGHAVRSVDSGKAAVDAVEAEDYRVVIINHMWEADDFQFLLRIKLRNPQTHVIVLTARATPQTERLARDVGAFDFLEKPFSLINLKQAVERAIVTPERRRGPRGCCGGCEWQKPCDRRHPLGAYSVKDVAYWAVNKIGNSPPGTAQSVEER